MHDQADQLRRLVRATVDARGDLAPGAPLIAITGAQPQIGATTVACGLARELASLGKQVTLIDANLARPTVAAALDVEPYGTFVDVLTGARRAIEVLTPAADRIEILAGGQTPAATPLDAEALARLHAEIAALSRQCDAVLIDAGAGMNPWVDRLWQLATHVLLATTPASQDVLGAYETLKLSHHERVAGKLQLVVTRCDDAADAARIHAGFSATCERFLGHAVKPPAVLPMLSATASDAADADAAFQRSLRLLAADLACDFRAHAARVPRLASFAFAKSAAPAASRDVETPRPPSPGLRRRLFPT
jgi:flagellar biosynthesis protein FlhG